jgi:hypothetical protein
MSVNANYLQELSAIFVADVRGSAYYGKLSKKEQEEFNAKVREEKTQGLHPLLPGANERELKRLSSAFQEELGIVLPDAVVEVLSQVDGFVENGVSLYGVDPEFRDDHFESGPAILSENQVYWSDYADTARRYLFLGDSDLWFFVIDLNDALPLALDRGRLLPKHHFDSVEEMVNDMMRQALSYSVDEEETDNRKDLENPPGNLFSRN